MINQLDALIKWMVTKRICVEPANGTAASRHYCVALKVDSLSRFKRIGTRRKLRYWSTFAT
jgi:hypothetical protein